MSLPAKVAELIEQAKQSLKAIEDTRQESIRAIVRNLAAKLEEAGYPLDMICEFICIELEGYCSARSVRDALDEKYKNKKQVREKSSSQSLHSSAVDAKKPIELSTSADGTSNADLSDDLADPVDAEMEAIPDPDPQLGKALLTVRELDRLGGGDGSPTEKAYRAEIEGLKMDNDRLHETLNEKQQEILELIKSINAAGAAKDKKNENQQQQQHSVKESVEYKALLSELSILKQERDELRALAAAQMKANPEQTFQNASSMKAGEQEVTLDAKEISTFFLDSRLVKQVMYLQVKDGKVVGWESDAKRQKP